MGSRTVGPAAAASQSAAPAARRTSGACALPSSESGARKTSATQTASGRSCAAAAGGSIGEVLRARHRRETRERKSPLQPPLPDCQVLAQSRIERTVGYREKVVEPVPLRLRLQRGDVRVNLRPVLLLGIVRRHL